MADFDAFIKSLGGNAPGVSSNKYDVEDELNELEDEVNGVKKDKKAGKKKKKDPDDLNLSDIEDDEDALGDEEEKKGDSDKELDKLSLDESDGEEEDSKEKEVKKENAEPPHPAVKPQTKENTSAPPTTEVQPKKVENTSDNKQKVDLYSETTENIYHKLNKMKSLGVLNNEKEQCDAIIKYKKSNGFDDYDVWEGKKDLIDAQITNVTNLVESGVMDLDKYKEYITQELNYEKQLLEVVDKDKKLPTCEIPVVKGRIQKRIDLINQELTESPEEEEEEEKKDDDVEEVKEEKEEPKKEEIPKKKEEPKKEKIDEALLNRVNLRLNEYKCAIDYFKNNGLTKQQEDAVLKGKELLSAIKKIESGDNDIDEFGLPMPITPEYIYGYSKEERLEKYKEILTEFIKQKNEIKGEIQKVIAKLQTLSKKDLKKIESIAKKDLDEKKAKIAKYDKLIDLLKEQNKNQWIPAPLYSKTIEEEKIEKINDKVPSNTLVIYVGKTDYDKDNIYLLFKLQYSDKTKTQAVNLKNGQNFDQEIQWQFDKSELKHLHRKTLEVQLYHKKFFGSKFKGTVTINLGLLKNQCEISDNYAIELESKRVTPKFEIKLSLRTPLVDPQYITKTKEVFAVTKFYPEFKITKTENDNSAVPPSTKPPAQITQQKPQTNSAALAADKPKQHIDGSKFPPEDLKDPDNVNNLNSMQVLNYKLAEIEKKIKSIEGRTPKPLRERLVNLKCKKKILEDSLGDTIDPPKYVEMMKIQLEKDQLLFLYFEQEKDAAKAALVKPRVTLLAKEIKEIEAELGQ